MARKGDHSPRGPYKFTEEKRGVFCGMLENGVGRAMAARACGVSIFTVLGYLNTDTAFEKMVNEAEARAIDKVESSIYNKALEGDVNAAKYVLNNLRANKWADKREVKVDANVKEQAKYMIKLWTDDSEDAEEEDDQSGS
jgi:hypothetical protein